jgi:hypothetical protein
VITVTISGGLSAGADAGCSEASSTNGWPANPLNAVDGSGNSCTSSCTAAATSGTLTTTQAEVLIIAWEHSAAAARTVTKDTGYADVAWTAGTSQTVHDEDKVTSSTFSGTVAFTFNSAPSGWAMRAVAYKNNSAASRNRIWVSGNY